MQRLPRFALVTFVLSVFVGCQQLPHSVIGPTAMPAGWSTPLASESDTPLFGSLRLGVHSSAAQESGFPCALFDVPPEQQGHPQSHATISESGNQTLHCSGQTLLPANTCDFLQCDNVACVMHFPDDSGAPVVGEGRFNVTPSGHATLTCHSKK